MKIKKRNPRASCPVCHLESANNTLPRHFCFETNIYESDRIHGIYRYWNHKRGDPKGFTITGPEMISLFDEAGIDPEDVGKEANKYQLARHSDEGGYHIGNCRFITMVENLKEKKSQKGKIISEEQRQKISNTLMGHKRSQESIEKQKRNTRPWTEERKARQREIVKIAQEARRNKSHRKQLS